MRSLLRSPVSDLQAPISDLCGFQAAALITAYALPDFWSALQKLCMILNYSLFT